jgi:flagellar motility protein MotE (MotC chaperone)
VAEPNMEKQTYGAFERLLYIFLIPLIFVTILLGVLLSLFDYDVMNSLLKVANKIPVVEKVIPDPKVNGLVTTTNSPSKPAAAEEETDLAETTAKLSKLEQEIQQSGQTIGEKDKTIHDLKVQITALEEKLKAKTQSDEEYKAQIQQLAGVYAKMSPSKSAPVLESLTLKEQVLILTEMKPDDRVKILEKMNPQAAAEASIGLKDLIPSKDLQIAALQERLKLNEAQTAPVNNDVSLDNLGQTFADMVPKSAADILIEMNTASRSKVLSILKAMDSAPRARVLAAIAAVDKGIAASMSADLAQ